jgi:hypothetical protein
MTRPIPIRFFRGTDFEVPVRVAGVKAVSMALLIVEWRRLPSQSASAAGRPSLSPAPDTPRPDKPVYEATCARY